MDLVEFLNDLIPDLKIVKLLGFDLYDVFEGYYQGHHVVVKIFSEKSDPTNEHLILKYLEDQNYTKSPRLYYHMGLRELTEYLGEHTDNGVLIISKDLLGENPQNRIEHEVPKFGKFDRWQMIEDPWEIIIYDYLEGTPVNILIEKHIGKVSPPNVILDKVLPAIANEVYIDIRDQIEELRELNIVHGDIKLKNMIKTNSDHYILIDYGRAIGINELYELFPPNEFTIEEDIIPSVEDDIRDLNHWVFNRT